MISISKQKLKDLFDETGEQTINIRRLSLKISWRRDHNSTESAIFKLFRFNQWKMSDVFGQLERGHSWSFQYTQYQETTFVSVASLRWW
jgi:hypothetical protein